MGMNHDTLLTRLKEALRRIYGTNLKGVVLYGSEARGLALPDSDIDILVLLDRPVEIAKDLRLIIEALYPFQLELDRPIHATPVDIRAYQAGHFALFRNAKREGIQL